MASFLCILNAKLLQVGLRGERERRFYQYVFDRLREEAHERNARDGRVLESLEPWYRRTELLDSRGEFLGLARHPHKVFVWTERMLALKYGGSP